MRQSFLRYVLTIAALPTLLACGAGRPAPAVKPGLGEQGPEAARARARADSARLPYTRADIDFMTHMIGHHAQAVRMSLLVPSRTPNGEVQRLAERIINAQRDEITTMQRWLGDRHQPVPDGSATTMRMTMNGMEHDMAMPGMLTDAQLKQLETAKGSEFDRLFLMFMIQHHRGAVSMVKDLFATPGAGQDETVFKFASDVNVDQNTEIARMEQMLLLLKLDGKLE